MAEDTLAAPASLAYVERIFSVRGLKLNTNALKESGFMTFE